MPAFPSWRAFLFSVLPLLPTAACYDMVREYSGQSFFDRWDFYGSWDNLTLGASPPARSFDPYIQKLTRPG